MAVIGGSRLVMTSEGVSDGVTSVDSDWQKQAGDHVMTIIKELPSHRYVTLNTVQSVSVVREERNVLRIIVSPAAKSLRPTCGRCVTA